MQTSGAAVVSKVMQGILATPRLTLRPFSLGDAHDLFLVRGDAVAMEHWDWPPDENIEQTRAMARFMDSEVREGTAVYFTARLADGEFVGLFDLSFLGETTADLGFMVKRTRWGQGYATEGARAMIAEARRRHLVALKARAHSGNETSKKLLLRIGFECASDPIKIEVMPGRILECEHFHLPLD